MEFVKDLVILGVGVGLTGGAMALYRRSQLRAAVNLEAQDRGLSRETAAFVSRLFWRGGPDCARELMRSPDLLRNRLATDLSSFRHLEVASRFADKIATLCAELNMRVQAFPGAPLLFEKVSISDPSDPDMSPSVAFVVAIDEQSYSLICVDECPWPVRHDLNLLRSEAEPGAIRSETSEASLASASGREDGAQVVTMTLRPMPGSREWVVTHDLLTAGVERRSAQRRACHVEAWLLPTTAGAYTLRGRLQERGSVDIECVQRLEAWPRRQRVTVEDLSCDGARVATDHEVRRGEQSYLVLSHADGSLAAMPLLEVVSVRNEDGRQILGTRFCAVRLKERMVLADYAQEAANATLDD
jgi:hypothetical protein